MQVTVLMGVLSYYEDSRQGAAEHHKQRTKEDPMMNENTNANEATKTNTQKNILEMSESALNEVSGGEFIDRVGPIYYHRNCGGRITTNTNFSGPRTPISYYCTVCGEEHSKIDQFDWYKTKRNQGGNPEY